MTSPQHPTINPNAIPGEWRRFGGFLGSSQAVLTWRQDITSTTAIQALAEIISILATDQVFSLAYFISKWNTMIDNVETTPPLLTIAEYMTQCDLPLIINPDGTISADN